MKKLQTAAIWSDEESVMREEREEREEREREDGAGGRSYPSSAGGGDVVVAALVAQLDAMLAQVRHAAQRAFSTVGGRRASHPGESGSAVRQTEGPVYTNTGST